MAEATLYKDADTIDVLAPTAGFTSGEVLQLPDGRAAVVQGLRSPTSGEATALKTSGQHTVAAINTLSILAGGRLWWDRSSGHATPIRSADSFYLGVAVTDKAATGTTVVVDLNAQQQNVIDLGAGLWDSVIVKTAGSPTLTKLAGGTGYALACDNTAEAQKVDLLSQDSIPVAAGAILEARVAVYDVGDHAAVDFNVGLANGTHASDADSITESVFIHVDGASLNLLAESDDGTTEVAAADTTVDAVDDTYFEIWIDARDLTSVKLYVNGVRVLAATTFKLDKATGPLKALVHLEKSANDTTADFRVDFLRARGCDLKAA